MRKYRDNFLTTDRTYGIQMNVDGGALVAYGGSRSDHGSSTASRQLNSLYVRRVAITNSMAKPSQAMLSTNRCLQFLV